MVTANKYGETRYLAYIGDIEDKYGELDNSWKKEEEINEIIEHGYYLIQFPKNIPNEVIKEAGEVKLVGDIIIPKGQYTIEHITDEGTEVLAISNNNASKVVDENGEPLVVYRAGEINKDGTLKTRYKAYYFTISKSVAEQYAKQENVPTHEFFLKADSINDIHNGLTPIIRSDGAKVPKRGLFEMPWNNEDVNIILEGKEAAYSDGEYLVPNSNQIKVANTESPRIDSSTNRVDTEDLKTVFDEIQAQKGSDVPVLTALGFLDEQFSYESYVAAMQLMLKIRQTENTPLASYIITKEQYERLGKALSQTTTDKTEVLGGGDILAAYKDDIANYETVHVQDLSEYLKARNISTEDYKKLSLEDKISILHCI